VARWKLVLEVGFTLVSESAQLLLMIKMVPRGGILHSGRTLDANSMRLSGRDFSADSTRSSRTADYTAYGWSLWAVMGDWLI